MGYGAGTLNGRRLLEAANSPSEGTVRTSARSISARPSLRRRAQKGSACVTSSGTTRERGIVLVFGEMVSQPVRNEGCAKVRPALRGTYHDVETRPPLEAGYEVDQRSPKGEGLPTISPGGCDPDHVALGRPVPFHIEVVKQGVATLCRGLV